MNKTKLKSIFIITGIVTAVFSYLLKITILFLVICKIISPLESTFIYVINELTNSTMYIIGGVAYSLGIKPKKGGENEEKDKDSVKENN